MLIFGLLCGFVLVLVVGFVICLVKSLPHFDPGFYSVAAIILGILGFVASPFPIITASQCLDRRIEIQSEYEAMRARIASAREAMQENDSVIHWFVRFRRHSEGIMGANAWIAARRVENESIYDWWVPDNVANAPQFTWDDLRGR